MRRIDGLISFFMWLTIAISGPLMLLVMWNPLLGSPWPYKVALCLLWLPPALSLAQLDGGPNPHSPWFYRFAMLALLWATGVAAYGIAIVA